MNFIIEKAQEPTQPIETDMYVVKYTKVAKTEDGTEVEVIDENRIEQVTVAQLEEQKKSYQNAIIEIDEKLKIIGELK